MSKPEMDIVDAVRDAVTWFENSKYAHGYMGQIIIGTLSGPDSIGEWISITHKFQNLGGNAYFSTSETEAKEHIIRDFAEFCEAARLIPDPLREGES